MGCLTTRNGKQKLEKQKINEQTTLIGHSCGCAFLVRWLGDSKQKIDKLILVAPWKIGTSSEAKKKFYEYPIDEIIKTRVNKIIMFTADNEEQDGKRSLEIFKDALGGTVIELKRAWPLYRRKYVHWESSPNYLRQF